MCSKIFLDAIFLLIILQKNFFLYQRKLTTNKKEAKERTKDKG